MYCWTRIHSQPFKLPIGDSQLIAAICQLQVILSRHLWPFRSEDILNGKALDAPMSAPQQRVTCHSSSTISRARSIDSVPHCSVFWSRTLALTDISQPYLYQLTYQPSHTCPAGVSTLTHIFTLLLGTIMGLVFA